MSQDDVNGLVGNEPSADTDTANKPIGASPELEDLLRKYFKHYNAYDGEIEQTLEAIHQLIATKCKEAVVGELESLSHNNQMYGDWQQVIDDRLEELEKCM